MAPETDAEVIAVSRAHAERFEAIFERHAASIHRYLRRRVGDRLAEELVQDAPLRPRLGAASYRAIVHLPKMRVMGLTGDGLGRRGIVVGVVSSPTETTSGA